MSSLGKFRWLWIVFFAIGFGAISAAADDDLVDSCDDIPVDGIGEPVAWETLSCRWFPMKTLAGTVMSEWPIRETTELRFSSENELETLLADVPAHLSPCPVDFDLVDVFGVGTLALNGLCTTVEICGVYDDGETRTIVAYHLDCRGPGHGGIGHQAYHLVTVPKSDSETVFDVRTRVEYRE